jgi:hypothetical protein
MALGQVFSEYFDFPCQCAFHRLVHNHHLSSGAGTIGQTVAAVPSGLSHRMRNKKIKTPQRSWFSTEFSSDCQSSTCKQVTPASFQFLYPTGTMHIIRYVLKVCDDGTVIQLLSFWTNPSSCFLFKTQRLGDWILSPSSGESLLS